MANRTAHNSLARRLRRLMLLLVLLPMLLSVGVVGLLRFIDPPLWAWQLHRSFAPPAGAPEQSRHQWVPLQSISPAMQLAVIAAEDQKFPHHPGFDADAIRAAWLAHQSGKRLRGASTLTQQTAKNLFLWPARSFIRKGLELWFTGWMELLLGKKRILELYLNIVEFGPGIYGVEAAAQHYYGRSAARLASSQAARMAAVLPNPWRFSVSRPSNYVYKRTRWIQQQMKQLGRGILQQL